MVVVLYSHGQNTLGLWAGCNGRGFGGRVGGVVREVAVRCVEACEDLDDVVYVLTAVESAAFYKAPETALLAVRCDAVE